MNKYFVYIVECSDSSLYTGSTDNITKRISEHSARKGSKILRGKLPIKLVYSESFASRSEALRREIEIKSWKRIKKLALIYNKNTAPKRA